MSLPRMAEEVPPQQARTWAIFLSLAVFLHMLMFLLKVRWEHPTPPPRVEVQQIDPRKLEAVRKQWRAKDRAVLLNENADLPKDQPAPKDARYVSDRNIRVEKEQRARDADVIPRPSKAAGAAAQAKASSRSRPQPELGKLGIPFNLSQKVTVARNSPRELRPVRPDARSEGMQDPGAHQRILDPRVAEGSENLLNTQESVYYSFYSRLYEAIGPLWQSALRETRPERKLQPGSYRTMVDVVLDGEGNLVDVRLMESSGVRVFDETVDRSWRKVKRFPNPPRGLLDSTGHIHMGWSFTVEVDKSMGLLYNPPEQNS